MHFLQMIILHCMVRDRRIRRRNHLPKCPSNAMQYLVKRHHDPGTHELLIPFSLLRHADQRHPALHTYIETHYPDLSLSTHPDTDTSSSESSSNSDSCSSESPSSTSSSSGNATPSEEHASDDTNKDADNSNDDNSDTNDNDDDRSVIATPAPAISSPNRTREIRSKLREDIHRSPSPILESLHQSPPRRPSPMHESNRELTITASFSSSNNAFTILRCYIV